MVWNRNSSPLLAPKNLSAISQSQGFPQGLDYTLSRLWKFGAPSSPPIIVSEPSSLLLNPIYNKDAWLRIVQSFALLPLGSAINRVLHMRSLSVKGSKGSKDIPAIYWCCKDNGILSSITVSLLADYIALGQMGAWNKTENPYTCTVFLERWCMEPLKQSTVGLIGAD